MPLQKQADSKWGSHFDWAEEEIESLYEESSEKIMGIEHTLLDFAEGRVQDSRGLINRIFRDLHTVKGASSMLGNEPLTRLSQSAENVLGAAREGRITLTPYHAEVLLQAVDQLKLMIGKKDRSTEVDCEAVLRLLDEFVRPHRSEPWPSKSSLGRVLSNNDWKGSGNAPRQLRSLVVEDDFTSRVVLQGILSRFGVCHIAVNGREAVEAFKTARSSGNGYDLVCMDIRMPEMDGTEALRQIREIEEADGICSTDGAKIFMTTGIEDMKTIAKSFKSLCDAYVFKPVDGSQIVEHMQSFGLISRAA